MENLTAFLEQEARKRGLIASDETGAAGSAFALVGHIPYRRASSRRPESIIEEWRGACSGKHYVLDQIFREISMDSRVIMCTHRFTPNNAGHFLAELRALVDREPVPDVHTYLRLAYLRLETALGWMTVDATWPSSAQAVGMPVNSEATQP